MASFSRTLNETITISSFLLSSGSLGYGIFTYSQIQNINSLGPFDYQPVYNQDSIGNAQSYLHSVANFIPAGQDQDFQGNMFDGPSPSTNQTFNMFNPIGMDADATWGLNFPRTLPETITVADAVDTDGNFIRSLSETIEFNDRLGVSKGVFFSDEPSLLVTGNPEIRLLQEIRDMGEVAVSERPSAGSLKVLRYVPGTDISTPNTADLGAIPSISGSQGFILDDSPHGVVLRGGWEVKLISHDTQADGQIKIHCSLFTVEANEGSTVHVYKIGPTKATATITPSLTPTQYTLSWTADETGEVYVGLDQYIYVEVYVEEVTKPGLISFSRFRLNDYGDTIWSQLQFPGVAPGATYERLVNETLTFSDSLAFIYGATATLPESITISDTLTNNETYSRQLSEIMGIFDFSLTATKNALFETITIIDSLERMVANNRTLAESVNVNAVLSNSGSSSHVLYESVPVVAELSGYIITPSTEKTTDQINKREVDKIILLKRRNLQ